MKALGDALAWVTLFEGRDRVFTLDKLPGASSALPLAPASRPTDRLAAERAFRVRARALNSRSRSAWSHELDIATRQVPTGCGGKVRSRET